MAGRKPKPTAVKKPEDNPGKVTIKIDGPAASVIAMQEMRAA